METEGRSKQTEGWLECEPIEYWQPFQEVWLWKGEMEQEPKKGIKVDHLFGFEKWGLSTYLNEDTELVESRKCGEDTRGVVTREKVTKEKEVKTS